MYDDGGVAIIYPPDITSGDAVKGDGIYSLTVGYPTLPGTYRFEFQALDRSNAFSPKIVHLIQVVQ
jgi:hypothetical protein